MNMPLRKPSRLKLPIYIAREHPCTEWHSFSPALQDMESSVWHGLAIKIKPVAVKPPGKAWILLKGARAGDLGKIEISFRQRWIGPPKALIAPEVWQAGVHPHTCTGRDDQCICASYNLCGLLKFRLGVTCIHGRFDEASSILSLVCRDSPLVRFDCFRD